jgi:hypothetical protein
MKKKNTLFVNIYGGPGCAKSTIAANVFAELKWRKIDCELVTEYAKKKVWEDSTSVLDDQLYVSAKQIHAMNIINGKVDVAICDSPMLLGLVYAKNEPESYYQMLVDYYNRFNNLDIFIERKKKYNPNGRMQTEEEAIEKDKEIYEYFSKYCSTIGTVPGTRDGVKKIVELILKIQDTD